MTSWAIRLPTLVASAGALVVLLLYSPALQAPFLVPKFAALEITAALGFACYAWQRVAGGRVRWSRFALASLLALFATSALSWLVAAGRPPGAPFAPDAMARWGALAGVASGVGLIADDATARRRVVEAVTIAASVVAAIGLLQHWGKLALSIPVISVPGSTFGNRNLAAEVMAMALPLGVGAALSRPKEETPWLIGGSLVLELTYLAVTRARGAWLGAGCGVALTMWLAHPRWSRGWLLTAAGGAVIAALAAVVPGHFNPRDAGDAKRYSGVVELLENGFDAQSTALRTRLGLWKRSLHMIGDAPIFGVGPGNWPVAFPLYAEPGASEDEVLSPTLAPRQAHQDLLERTAETGLVGLAAFVALGLAAAAGAKRRLRADDPSTRVLAASAAGSLAACAATGLTGFPLEMPGTIALTGVALGLVALQPVERAPDGPLSPGWIAVFGSAAILFLAGAVLRAEDSARASRLFAAARRTMYHVGGRPGAAQALRTLERAHDAAPDDLRIDLQTARALIFLEQWGAAAQSARDALWVEPHSPNAWAMLAEAQLGDHRLDAARVAASRALNLLHDYPTALELRARAAETADPEAAHADRDRLRLLATGSAGREIARTARALLREAPAH